MFLKPSKPIKKEDQNSEMKTKTVCCRHRILYPLQLKPLFPSDVRIQKLKVGLGLDHMKINLRKVFVENTTYF